MRRFRTYLFGEIRRPYGVAVRIGLLTAAVILLFGMVNTLVIYRYMRLDLYLCLVAIFFLSVGLWVNGRKEKTHLQEAVSMTDQIEALDMEETKAGKQVVNELLTAMKTDNVLELLSAKEWQILKLVAQGKTNKEIAAVQFVELSTVKTHLNNIYGKLSISNRKEARAKYAEFAQKWPVTE